MFDKLKNVYALLSDKAVPETFFAGFLVDLLTPHFIQQIIIVVVGVGVKAVFDKYISKDNKK